MRNERTFGNKVSKSHADYRLGNDFKRCSICAMFRPDTNSCTAVKGMIQGGMVCDLFKRKT